MRAAEITDDYADFARDSTLSYAAAIESLEELSARRPPAETFVAQATKIFHYGMAHIPPKDIEEKGFTHFKMRVSIWENYLLFLASFLKPDTYMDYEFCSYKKALARGAGRCGQQSGALIGYLQENDFDTGLVHLGGHTLATAKVSDNNWYMLDPDFGGVIPFGLETAQKSPQKVIEHYWNTEPVINRNLPGLYASERGNKTVFGGPEIRHPRGCVIEKISYIAKWVFPLALFAIASVLWLSHRRISAHSADS